MLSRPRGNGSRRNSFNSAGMFTSELLRSFSILREFKLFSSSFVRKVGKYGKARRIKEFRHIREELRVSFVRSCLHHVVKLINSSSCLPSKCFTLRVLHDEPGLLLQQLNCEGVGDNHKHHRHIKREQWAEDEEGSVVDGAYSRLRHDVLVIENACNVKCEFAFPCKQLECTHPGP